MILPIAHSLSQPLSMPSIITSSMQVVYNEDQDTSHGGGVFSDYASSEEDQ